MYRLDGEADALVERLRRLAEEYIAPQAADVDARGRFPREAITALGEAGFLGLNVPVAYGGMGQGMRVACVVLDEVARRCASSAMVYLMHLCGTAAYVANGEASAETLRAIAAGRHLTTLAFSEQGSRSHFWAPVSKAVRKGDRVVLSARKSFVTSAGEADSYVVSTGTPEGEGPGGGGAPDVTLYAVLRDDAGLAVSGRWESLGLRGNASAPMTLDGCEIPADRALCAPGDGFRTMLEVVLPWFNLGSGAISTGIAEAAVGSTTVHLTATRFEHLGSRLADLPILRERLARMRIETDRSRALLGSTLDLLEGGDASAVRFVLEVKAAAAESAVAVTDLGMLAGGGAAYGKHLTLERNFRDARAAGVMGPTTDVLHEFAGRILCGMDLF